MGFWQRLRIGWKEKQESSEDAFIDFDLSLEFLGVLGVSAVN